MDKLNFMTYPKEYLKDFFLRFTYHSNAIEGSRLTLAETYAILYNDNSFKINGKEPREIYEAMNHKKALEFILKHIEKNNDLNDRFIKKINEIINDNILGTEGYRRVQVYIRGLKHISPEPEKIPNLMNYFVYNYNHDEQNIFNKIATYHINFEKTHPFEDGNGRTGRLLINYELIKNNLSPVVIDKENKAKYFEMLRNNNVNDFAKWLEELSDEEQNRIEQFRNMNKD